MIASAAVNEGAKGLSTSGRIAVAARGLLDAEGAEAVTMRRVARAVGITAMAVYRHFPDRAGLLNALADQGFAELAGRTAAVRAAAGLDPSTAGAEERLVPVLQTFLDYALEHPRLFELMFLKPRAGARQYPRDFRAGASPTANLTADAVRDGIARGELRDVDPWEITFEMGALLQGLIMLYLGGRMDMPEPEFREFCRRSLRRYIHGIRK